MLRKGGSPLVWTPNYDDRASSDFKDVETATCGSLLEAIDTYTLITAPVCKLMYLYEGSVYAVSNLAFDESALIIGGFKYSIESFHELIRNAIEAYSDPKQDTEFQAPVTVRDVRVEGMLRKGGSPLVWTPNYDDRASSDFKDVETATCGSLLEAIDTYTLITAPVCKLMYLYEGSVYAVSNLAFDESALIIGGFKYSIESFHELIRNAIEAYSDPKQDTEFQAPVTVRGEAI
ncbi:hypothetical protein CSKR_202386 [Clonorchis sinensis]|uniref:Uncharacterized protein n=1 Tax=Clonorchis sinensis TaxID=79923 RepID=A0A8T1MVY5_CLOSI|nr:hypothetical protein CSKR_202386 [Clonorchis sinensis]